MSKMSFKTISIVIIGIFGFFWLASIIVQAIVLKTDREYFLFFGRFCFGDVYK